VPFLPLWQGSPISIITGNSRDKAGQHGGDKARAISRRLWRIIDGIENEEEDEEDEDG
jgi:hypothetical protein